MKQLLFLMAAFLISLAMYVQCYAAATLVTSYTEKHVGENTRYIYTPKDTVGPGSLEVFKIPTLKTDGKIEEIAFESGSDNVDIWLSGSDAQLATSVQTYIYITDINLGYSPEIKERDYINLDTPIVKYLYFTVDNNSDNQTETGSWILTIDYIRN